MGTSSRNGQIRRINELQDHIAQQPTHLTEFYKTLARRWLKQIIVCHDHFTVELKPGLSIEIEG